MPAYRFESAKSGRSGCSAPPCKQNAVKIPKGELRFGPWVETDERGWYSWRHWGCITPRQLANLAEAINGDYDLLDGYDELDQEDQNRVRAAIESGHIPDEDCVTVDPALNRLGAAEAAKEAEKEAKKRAKEQEGEQKKAEKLAEKEAKKQAKKQAKELEKEQKKAEKLAAKEAAKLEKQAACEAKTEEKVEKVKEEDPIDEAGPAKRKRNRGKAEEEAPKPPTQKRTRVKKEATKKEEGEEVQNLNTNAEDRDSAIGSEVEVKPKKTRKASTKVKPEAELPVEPPTEAEAPEPATDRKKGATKSKVPRAPSAAPTRRSTRNKSH